MSSSDENLYRGDAPASAPPPGYGQPPPGYGQAPPPGYGPAPGYGPPPPYGVNVGYGVQFYGPRPTNTMAILSLVLAFVFAPAGLVLGIMARQQIRRTGEEGDGLALAGIIVGGIFTAIFVLMIVFMIVAFSTVASMPTGP
jgi:hypothetical protein